MQIQATNNYSRNNQQTNFKSAYPVIYWVKNTGTVGKEAPTITKDLTEKLQSKLVRYLNRTFSKSDPQKVNIMGRAFTFLRREDTDYQNSPIVRSFYNTSAGTQKNGIKPIAYLLTGKDVVFFENTYAKPIGRNRAESPVINGKRNSAELDIAINKYHKQGFNYVKNRAEEFRKKGEITELHVQFEPILDKNGAPKDYILSNMTFRPTSQRNISPFEEIKNNQ